TCVILDNTQVKCFGHNAYGQLGMGDSVVRGRDANTMGDFLPAVDFGTHRHAVRLSNSGFHATCALLNTAELVCWGRNYEYVFGMGISKDVHIGDNPGEMGDNLVAITLPTGKTVVHMWIVTHVVVIFDDHTMTAWGRASGGFNLGNMIMNAPVGNDLSDMGDNLHIIDLGEGRKPVQVMLNWRATIVLFDNGDVVGFGRNDRASLGTGTSSSEDPLYHIGDNAAEMGNGIPLIDFGTGVKVRGLASNTVGHFCVVTYTNEVKCWGQNEKGALGLGDENDRGDETNEMGDYLPAVDLG
ncbi:regulator of chromosome condensation 1/beta-lactamase-inhibitor protein II, partial [Baffinella frigidus]